MGNGLDNSPLGLGSYNNLFTSTQEQGGNYTVSFKLKSCCLKTNYCTAGWTEGVEVFYTITVVYQKPDDTFGSVTIQDNGMKCTNKCIEFAISMSGVPPTPVSVSVVADNRCICCLGGTDDMTISDPAGVVPGGLAPG